VTTLLRDTGLGERAEMAFNLLDFRPEPKQMVILESQVRFKLVSGGEQAGKSLIAAKELVVRHIDGGMEKKLYWLVAADYERTRAEFEYLVQDFTRLGLLTRDVSKRIDPGHMVLKDGTRIETKSARDPRTIAMKAPDGIIGCEASQLDLLTYHKLQARTGPKRGWLFMSGTMEGGLGWYPGLIQAWAAPGREYQSFILPTSSNTYLYPGGENDPELLRLRQQMPDDLFKERFEGVPCPPSGLVFPEVRADVHVRDVEWDENEVVHLAEDPGYNHAHAILAWQVINGQIRIFDEIYERGRTTEDLIDHILAQRPWWKALSGAGIRLVSDPSYKDQHHAMTSVAETWMAKTGLYAFGEKVRVNEGTERLKTFLKVDPLSGEPGIIIDPKCQGLLSEFGLALDPFDSQQHVYRWDTDREGNIVGQQPKDIYNDAIKAMIYGVCDVFGMVRRAESSVIPVKRW